MTDFKNERWPGLTTEADQEPAQFYENFNLENICTPIKFDELQKLLYKTHYRKDETMFLTKGFRKGFTIGYKGPMLRQDSSRNISFTPGVGNKIDMWNKIMKEVKLGRYAGPFNKIPFRNFVQSPIGLVPKAGGQTRLIFHLSYKFKNGNESINFWTPKERCSVHYSDIDQPVCNCLKLMQQAKEQTHDGSYVFNCLFFGKTDLKSAFHLVPIKQKHWMLLILKAENPLTGEVMYFVDKCMPFGASISCSHFQRLSNALRHIVEVMEKLYNSVTNYLDDFLFIHYIKQVCISLMHRFLNVCKQICFPVADEKTEWPCQIVIFLGMILNGKSLTLMVPEDKKQKAINQLHMACVKKKLTVKEIQEFTGILNFLNRAIVPGRVFTRRMYTLLSSKIVNGQGVMLKQHHHINLTREFWNDCEIWTTFLTHQQVVNRKFVNFSASELPEEICFYSDSSKNVKLGFGCYFGGNWLFGQWEQDFIQKEDPSIAYLELFALTAGILAWGYKIQNKKMLLHCDNQSVVHMMNNMTSSCINCMYLLRLLALDNLLYNRTIQVSYIDTKANYLADYLSRLMIKKFISVAPAGTKCTPDKVPADIWPLSRIWQH